MTPHFADTQWGGYLGWIDHDRRIVAGGDAIWFEVDEIRLLAGAGGSVGEIAMLASTIEWGGVVELAMAGLLSRTMVARLPVLRHYLWRRAGRTTIRARRPGSPANDDGEGEPGRLAA